MMGAAAKIKQCTVLGIGNTLLGDEGIGVHIVEGLRKKYHFSPETALINGGCGGLNLYFILEQYDPVIIVDSLSLDSGEPGSVHVINGDMLTGQETEGCSVHYVGIRDVLMLLQTLTGSPNDLVVVGVVPAVIDYNFKLSTIVERQVALVERTVIQQLRLRNIEVSEL
jgi:hydrogenase maturation protease